MRRLHVTKHELVRNMTDINNSYSFDSAALELHQVSDVLFVIRALVWNVTSTFNCSKVAPV